MSWGRRNSRASEEARLCQELEAGTKCFPSLCPEPRGLCPCSSYRTCSISCKWSALCFLYVCCPIAPKVTSPEVLNICRSEDLCSSIPNSRFLEEKTCDCPLHCIQIYQICPPWLMNNFHHLWTSWISAMVFKLEPLTREIWMLLVRQYCISAVKLQKTANMFELRIFAGHGP